MLIKGILIILCFFFFSYLMFRQKISTFIALLGMALLIVVVSGIPLNGKKGILDIISTGSTGMATSILALIFGAWLGQIMNEVGITRDLIKRATELGGDKPIILTASVSIAVALIFTALSGLGSTIMVGTLVLPILTTIGIKPAVAGVIFLFARAVGYNFNLYIWSLFINVTGLSIDVIKNFGLVVTAVSALLLIVYLFVEFKFRKVSVAWQPPNEAMPKTLVNKRVPIFALLTPFIPILLVIFLKWEIVPAIMAGCIYGVLTTDPKNCLMVWNKTIQEAIKSAAPAIALMIAIGIVVEAVKNPQVSENILAIMNSVLPSNKLSYILFFVILSPLALYRGPLNMFGLGSGVIAVFVTAGTLPATAIMAAFFSAQVVQQAGDPTNTHNVWTADFVGVEVNEITKRILPYLWAISSICVVIASFMYF